MKTTTREKTTKMFALIFAIAVHIGVIGGIMYATSPSSAEETSIESEKGKKEKVAELGKKAKS